MAIARKQSASVGLHWMNGNVEGRSAPSLSEWIGVGDGPRNLRACAIAGTSEQLPQLFKSEAKRRGCGENVGGGTKWKMLP